KNSLPIRRQRYGQSQHGPSRGALIAGATAASVALLVGPALGAGTPAPNAAQHQNAPSSLSQPNDIVPAKPPTVTQTIVTGFETANSTLKQKLRSTLNKMWAVAKGQSPDKDKSTNSKHSHSHDLLP